MRYVGYVIAVVLIVASLQPIQQARILSARRHRLIRKIEPDRGSRVTTMIHSLETRNILGIAMTRTITHRGCPTDHPGDRGNAGRH